MPRGYTHRSAIFFCPSISRPCLHGQRVEKLPSVLSSLGVSLRICLLFVREGPRKGALLMLQRVSDIVCLLLEARLYMSWWFYMERPPIWGFPRIDEPLQMHLTTLANGRCPPQKSDAPVSWRRSCILGDRRARSKLIACRWLDPHALVSRTFLVSGSTGSDLTGSGFSFLATTFSSPKR